MDKLPPMENGTIYIPNSDVLEPVSLQEGRYYSIDHLPAHEERRSERLRNLPDVHYIHSLTQHSVLSCTSTDTALNKTVIPSYMEFMYNCNEKISEIYVLMV